MGWLDPAAATHGKATWRSRQLLAFKATCAHKAIHTRIIHTIALCPEAEGMTASEAQQAFGELRHG